jgi:hypothetical protein
MDLSFGATGFDGSSLSARVALLNLQIRVLTQRFRKKKHRMFRNLLKGISNKLYGLMLTTKRKYDVRTGFNWVNTRKIWVSPHQSRKNILIENDWRSRKRQEWHVSQKSHGIHIPSKTKIEKNVEPSTIAVRWHQDLWRRVCPTWSPSMPPSVWSAPS